MNGLNNKERKALSQQKMMAIRTKVYADLTRFKGKCTERDGVNYSYSDVIAMLLQTQKVLHVKLK